jgi:excisionase family DNA binding protein
MTLIPTREAARILPVSARTVRRMAQDGEIPGWRVNGRWYFDEVELREFLDRRRVMRPDVRNFDIDEIMRRVS